MRLHTTVVLTLILLTSFACAAGARRPEASAAPRPAPTVATTSALDAWRSKGASEVPPEAVRQVASTSVEVVNQTHGAISDADARAWALGLLHSSSYDDWALNRMQDGFLQRGGLSSAPQAVFATEFHHIQAARAAGMHLEVRPQTIRRLVLRSMPDATRQLFAAQQMTWSPYAFYVDKIGPSELAYVDAAGTRTVKVRLDAGVGVPELFAGQFVHDDVLGDVWRLDSDFDCSTPASSSQLGGACGP